MCFSDTDHSINTCCNGCGVFRYPVGNSKPSEHRESKNEDVARRVHVCILLKMEISHDNNISYDVYCHKHINIERILI